MSSFPLLGMRSYLFFICNRFVFKVDKLLMTRSFSKNYYFSEYRVLEHFRFPRLLQLLLFSPSCSILNWWRTESVPQHCFPGRVWFNLQVTSQRGTSERWMGGEKERERRRKSTVVKVRVQLIAEISKSQGRGVTMSTSKYFPSNYAWDWMELECWRQFRVSGFTGPVDLVC